MRRPDTYNRARLHAIDLVIIVGYLAAVVAAGAWFGRRQETTTRYFLAGRGVPWWAISASIVATETSTPSPSSPSPASPTRAAATSPSCSSSSAIWSGASSSRASSSRRTSAMSS
jgi:hypothetical protein